jgi:hypothetical protein
VCSFFRLLSMCSGSLSYLGDLIALLSFPVSSVVITAPRGNLDIGSAAVMNLSGRLPYRSGPKLSLNEN